MHSLPFKISAEMRQEIDDLSKIKGVSRPELIRRFIRRGLEEQSQQQAQIKNHEATV